MRLRSCFAATLIALAGLMMSSTARAADWPRFRGPNGTGISADKNIPIKFDAKNGLLWKVEIPGLGNSSPITWGDKLFLQTAGEDGKERFLLCLDVATGKILWKASDKGGTAYTHDRNTLASSTPATDGQRVYTLFWDGKEITLHAYDMKGEPVWKREVGPFTSGRNSLSQHGAGASPMIAGDKVILNYDTDKFAKVVAFDSKTGKPAWTAERRSFRACYSTPFLLEKKDGSPQLIVASTAGITSYDPKDGKENWDYPWKFDKMALRTVASPIYTKGLVISNSGDGSGDRHLIAVKIEGNGGTSKPTLAWENKKTFPYVPTLLAWKDHVYFINDLGIAGCCVAETGKMIWSERVCAGATSSPILIDGKVYVVSEKGEMCVFAADTKFKLLAKSDLEEQVMATPSVANGRLFIRGREHLFCVGNAATK